ncbi:MAG: hypothetical protein ACYTGN_02025 [Planctomycetota bacterium]|jgi:hypothetical protein
MECDVCGSRNVARREIDGYFLEECGLCGNLQGDDRAVALIEELREGRARGLDDEVIPLVSVLEKTGAFHVLQATATPPQVLLELKELDARPIERLLRSIEMANRKTKRRWLIELSLQHGVVYILRPRFWQPPQEISPADLKEAGADFAILARHLRRDLGLSLWQ